MVKITARDTGANTLTVTRGAYGTRAEAWWGDDQLKPGKGTRVEEVLHYSTADGLDGLPVDEVVNDLLQRAGVASGDIDATSLADAKKWIGPWMNSSSWCPAPLMPSARPRGIGAPSSARLSPTSR